MTHLVFVIVLLLAAGFFALVEIQIEGGSGWASDLPTWRVQNRVTRALFGNRAVTGYHLYFQLFILTILHLPFAVGAKFSWTIELRLLAFGALFWVLEDFLWFAFNPTYGIRGFTRERAWWHAANWWGFMPRDYWLFLPLGIGLYLLSYS